MKALVYEKAHRLDEFAIQLVELPEPTLRDRDVLVDVRAIGVNPGETFFRRTRSADPGGRVLLGWEFAGVVLRVGPAASGFAVGDRVFGTGDITRDGAWAERVAVDHRIIARIPDVLPFADAASLPIGGVTAWEAILRDQAALPAGVERVLVVGGAGAVGSLATQLLKATTGAFVIGTASRAESRSWSLDMGADLVVDHGSDVEEQLASAGIHTVDMVLSTAGTSAHGGWIANVLRPFGHLAVVDAPTVDLTALVPKSVSLHTEMVFSRLLHGSAPEVQGGILSAIAKLVAEGRLRSIATTRLTGLTPATMRIAHERLETGRTIGKVVIAI